jgi:oligopeptidase B
VPWNGYLYYVRWEEGKNYEMLCRKQGDMDAPEQILIDLNTIAGEFLALGGWLPSPDNSYLAYELDQTGEEFWTIHVLDMTTGQEVEQLPDSTAFEWGNDSQTLYYCKQDPATHRLYELYRHSVGTDQATDPLLYHEDDEQFWLFTLTSKDRAYTFLYSSAFDTFETWYLPTDQPTAEFTLFAPRRSGVTYFLEHSGDEFLVLTDDNAPNFKLMAAPVADPTGAWREVVSHRDNALLEWFDVFERHLVVYGREDGFSQVWVRDLETGETVPLAFDEAVYATGPGANPEYQTTKLRIEYTSLVTPPSSYEIDMETGERTLLKQEEVIGGHDPSRYISERLFATAPDGTQVPISLVYLREGDAGPRPLRMDGYGGYGISSDPIFAINRLALINRGVTYAIAHIRGGQELGRRWWEEGRLLNKKNCFSDFIACAEHLIQEGHTAPDRLLISGGSNGGLLMGSVATQRPDLFKAVVAEVPLVDVIGFLLRSDIGAVNRDELGDPYDATYGAYIRSYSPYETARVQDYPAMLVTGGLNDTRVPYWNPAKWVAKLRDVKTDENVLLLRTEMGAGHGGVSGFYDQEQEVAFLYAFFLMTLGMEDAVPAGATAATPPRAAKRADVATSRASTRVGSSLVAALLRRFPERGARRTRVLT